MRSREHFLEQMQCRGLSLADGRFALSGSKPHYAPDRTFDTQHMKLEAKLDFTQKSLSGLCTTTLSALVDDAVSMVFDAVDFKILKVSSPQRPVTHRYDGRQITVQWKTAVPRGQKIDIVIAYRVTSPKLGLHFVGPDKGYPKKPRQVWTQGEDEYNRFWFPCHDAPQERMTTETLITVPESFTAVSNGALIHVSSSRAAKTRTFHWKQNVPHSPYLVSMAVGQFTEMKDKWRNVPVLYFCPPGREDDARRAFDKTPKMMEFFSKALGVPYAYAKYSQVAAIDFIYGGMENTSCTTQTITTLHDERAHLDFSSDPLVAHELAHQWFGDLVTCNDWAHAWLNESFATYFEALFKEHDLGHDEFVYEIWQNAQAYLDEDKDHYRRPIMTQTYKNPTDLFDRHLYEKGSVVLHMLRRLLGDDAWWRSMNVYLKRHRTQGVETVDLIDAIQDATGRNMRPFFDQWIFKAGHPEYKVRTWWDAKQKKLFLRVLQTHGTNAETGLFSVPITFRFYTAPGKALSFTETIAKKDELFSYALPKAPVLVLFDPEHHVLKKLDIVKPVEMWIFQLEQDPHVLGRREAAEALGRLGSPLAVAALARALCSEKFWGVGAEVARALAKAGTPAALEGLLEGHRVVEDPKIRRVIYEALGSFRQPAVLQVIRDSYSKEASYLVEAEAIRALGRMKEPSLLELFKQLVTLESWNDVLRCAALDAIALIQLPESLDILKSYSAYGHSPSARMTAIRGLGSFGQGREELQNVLIKLLSDPYLLVQLSVVRALGQFGDERAADALLPYTLGDLDGRLKRTAEEAIRRIRKGMEQEMPTSGK